MLQRQKELPPFMPEFAVQPGWLRSGDHCIMGGGIYIYIYILETKIAPEMLGLEDEFAFLGPGLPAGVMLVFGSVYCSV